MVSIVMETVMLQQKKNDIVQVLCKYEVHPVGGNLPLACVLFVVQESTKEDVVFLAQL